MFIITMSKKNEKTYSQNYTNKEMLKRSFLFNPNINDKKDNPEKVELKENKNPLLNGTTSNFNTNINSFTNNNSNPKRFVHKEKQKSLANMNKDLTSLLQSATNLLQQSNKHRNIDQNEQQIKIDIENAHNMSSTNMNVNSKCNSEIRNNTMSKLKDKIPQYNLFKEHDNNSNEIDRKQDLNQNLDSDLKLSLKKLTLEMINNHLNGNDNINNIKELKKSTIIKTNNIFNKQGTSNSNLLNVIDIKENKKKNLDIKFQPNESSNSAIKINMNSYNTGSNEKTKIFKYLTTNKPKHEKNKSSSSLLNNVNNNNQNKIHNDKLYNSHCIMYDKSNDKNQQNPFSITNKLALQKDDTNNAITLFKPTNQFNNYSSFQNSSIKNKKLRQKDNNDDKTNTRNTKENFTGNTIKDSNFIQSDNNSYMLNEFNNISKNDYKLTDISGDYLNKKDLLSSSCRLNTDFQFKEKQNCTNYLKSKLLKHNFSSNYMINLKKNKQTKSLGNSVNIDSSFNIMSSKILKENFEKRELTNVLKNKSTMKNPKHYNLNEINNSKNKSKAKNNQIGNCRKTSLRKSKKSEDLLNYSQNSNIRQSNNIENTSFDNISNSNVDAYNELRCKSNLSNHIGANIQSSRDQIKSNSNSNFMLNIYGNILINIQKESENENKSLSKSKVKKLNKHGKYNYDLGKEIKKSYSFIKNNEIPHNQLFKINKKSAPKYKKDESNKNNKLFDKKPDYNYKYKPNNKNNASLKLKFCNRDDCNNNVNIINEDDELALKKNTSSLKNNNTLSNINLNPQVNYKTISESIKTDRFEKTLFKLQTLDVNGSKMNSISKNCNKSNNINIEKDKLNNANSHKKSSLNTINGDKKNVITIMKSSTLNSNEKELFKIKNNNTIEVTLNQQSLKTINFSSHYNGNEKKKEEVKFSIVTGTIKQIKNDSSGKATNTIKTEFDKSKSENLDENKDKKIENDHLDENMKYISNQISSNKELNNNSNIDQIQSNNKNVIKCPVKVNKSIKNLGSPVINFHGKNTYNNSNEHHLTTLREKESHSQNKIVIINQYNTNNNSKYNDQYITNNNIKNNFNHNNSKNIHLNNNQIKKDKKSNELSNNINVTDNKLSNSTIKDTKHTCENERFNKLKKVEKVEIDINQVINKNNELEEMNDINNRLNLLGKEYIRVLQNKLVDNNFVSEKYCIKSDSSQSNVSNRDDMIMNLMNNKKEFMSPFPQYNGYNRYLHKYLCNKIKKSLDKDNSNIKEDINEKNKINFFSSINQNENQVEEEKKLKISFLCEEPKL